MSCVYGTSHGNRGQFVMQRSGPGQSWTLRAAGALPISAFSFVPESLEAVPPVNEGHRLRGDSGQSEIRQAVTIWEGSLSSVPALPHHCLPWLRIQGPIFSFSSTGILMRKPRVYSTCNGPPQSRNRAMQQHQCFVFFFSLSAFSLCNGNPLFQHLWREYTSN